ncbi:nucleotidyltransferase family protein [Metasolibacillus meyeri]|uniref:nucleotidyltransferase family protein n=1 Tax=Metasolibacillus meyeri TaxID=1071052 RepID=UPI003B75C4BD
MRLLSNWKDAVIKENFTILEAMRAIDKSTLQFAVVIDEKEYLLGTVTDGDIRRGILQGQELGISITSIMNKNPTTSVYGREIHEYKQLMRSKQLRQLPVVDENNKIIDIIFMDKFDTCRNENTVILMLGGLGTRLRPLTNDIPKPMLKIGNKPILETIVESFKQYGYTNFIFSVNYKKEIIQEYFRRGEAFDVTIEYIEENIRMGTAGALSLLKKRPSSPFFVMNGDLLTQINFEQLMQFHIEHNTMATMCVIEYEYQIPYGVIETVGTDLVDIKEKPVKRCFINAGIYVLNPEVFDYIPNNQFYDMPALFEELIKRGEKTSVFPIHEHWLDIGRVDDFNRANNEFKEYYE